MKYYTLHLTGSLTETAPSNTSPLSFFQKSGGLHLDELYVQVEMLLKKKSVGIILVHWDMDFEPGLYGNLESLRELMVRLVQGGKEVWFFSKEYQTHQLYLASGCTKRILHPLGSTAFLGFHRRFSFYKRLLDKHNIKAEIIRVGRYKAAGDSFRVESLDDNNRAQYDAFFDTVIQGYTETICKGYKKDGSEFMKLQKGIILPAGASLEAGWVDTLATLDDVRDDCKTKKLKIYKGKKTKLHFGRGAKIAVLEFEGGIKDGESARNPLFGAMTGSASFIPTIQKLAKDKSVKGVVFRVNSGGGSATASEDIARELIRLKQKKPLVVSMGGVAGSGGYWIAKDGSRIFAQKTTITGSIGVITIHFYIQKFLEKFGITDTIIRRGEFSDLGSPYRELTDVDRDVISKHIQTLYQDFLSKVAGPRNLTEQRVHELGEGHIYSGQEALGNGLVDEIGGLTQAIEYLKNQLSLNTARVFFTPRPKRTFLSKILGIGALTKSDSLSGIGTSVLVNPGDVQKIVDPLHGKPLALTEYLYF